MTILVTDDFSGVSGIWTDVANGGSTVAVGSGVKTINNNTGAYTDCGFVHTAGIAPRPQMYWDIGIRGGNGSNRYVHVLVRDVAAVDIATGAGIQIIKFDDLVSVSSFFDGAGIAGPIDAGASNVFHSTRIVLNADNSFSFFYDGIPLGTTLPTGYLQKTALHYTATEAFTQPTDFDNFQIGFTEENSFLVKKLLLRGAL